MAFSIYFVLMTCGSCADRLILYPSTQPLRAAGSWRVPLPRQRGTAQAAEVELWPARAMAFPTTRPGGPAAPARPAEPAAFVLAFIGNADRAEYAADRAAEEWAGHPVEVWAVNYPGYGGSTGPARLAAIPPAALAAYDALRARAGNRPIFVSGLSLGTAAALHVAANRPVAGVVLQNPPPLRKLILGKFGWWNLWLVATPVALHIPSQLDSIANARKVHAPGVFLLAEKDQLVPPPYQEAVCDAFAGEQHRIALRGAGHNDPPDEQAMAELREALDWMWRTVVVPSGPATAESDRH